MLVGDRMSRPVITVRPEMPVPDALNLMKKDHVRRFPVIDGRGKLVGIISEQDLINASASDATTLSVWELSYLLSKITIAQVMTRDVFTISQAVLQGQHLGGFMQERWQHVAESVVYDLLLIRTK